MTPGPRTVAGRAATGHSGTRTSPGGPPAAEGPPGKPGRPRPSAPAGAGPRPPAAADGATGLADITGITGEKGSSRPPAVPSTGGPVHRRSPPPAGRRPPGRR
ncbi:hypothetical protein A4U61_03815 [Streptomyces sp. H-KF8]|nr:hypothetical protein A4U61_03815 [Streptomyces sp. H-KF8]